jgi:hypothetical protein
MLCFVLIFYEMFWFNLKTWAVSEVPNKLV